MPTVPFDAALVSAARRMPSATLRKASSRVDQYLGFVTGITAHMQKICSSAEAQLAEG
jgi:hypothetical protein